MNADGTDIRLLTDEGQNDDRAFDEDPAVSPDGTRVAFGSNRDHNLEIYVVRIATGELENLTKRPGSAEHSPAWSPDGRRIAYVSGDASTSQIHVMNSDGSVDRALTHPGDADTYPDWSPDGSRITFTRRESPDAAGLARDGVFVMVADGSQVRELSEGNDEHSDYAPDWSPDGQRIAFVRDGAVWAMAADGSGATKLLEGKNAPYESPAWSPDGRSIAFNDLPPSQGSDVFLANADGSALVNVTDQANQIDAAPVWTPNGGQLVFETTRGSIKPEGRVSKRVSAPSPPCDG